MHSCVMHLDKRCIKKVRFNFLGCYLLYVFKICAVHVATCLLESKNVILYTHMQLCILHMH